MNVIVQVVENNKLPTQFMYKCKFVILSLILVPISVITLLFSMNSMHQSNFFDYIFTNPASSLTVKYFHLSSTHTTNFLIKSVSACTIKVSSIQLLHTAQHFSSEPITGETIAVTPCEVRTNRI